MVRQRQLDRCVVLKILHPGVDHTPEQIARFRSEAQVTALLSHPHIVRVIDHGVDGGIAWIAYEHVEGPSLRERLTEGPLPWRQACRMAHQVAAALETAHARGILHRDIKPDNVLEAAPGDYKVADFGVAKWSGSAVQTEAGVILGTPAYLSPQQLRGLAPAFESDVYALGVMLFEVLTGRLPFWDDNLLVLLQQRLANPAPSVSSLVHDLPRGVDRIVSRALATGRDERFRHAAEMREALEDLLNDRTSGSTATKVRRAPPPACHAAGPRLRPRAGAVLLVTVAALAGVAAGVWRARGTLTGEEADPSTPPVFTPVSQQPSRATRALPTAGQRREIDRLRHAVWAFQADLETLPREGYLLALHADRIGDLTKRGIEHLRSTVRLVELGGTVSWTGAEWLELDGIACETIGSLDRLQANAHKLPELRTTVERLRKFAQGTALDPYMAVVATTTLAYVLRVEGAPRGAFDRGTGMMAQAERKLAELGQTDPIVGEARLRLLENQCVFISRATRSVAAELEGSSDEVLAERGAHRPVRERQISLAHEILAGLPPELSPRLRRVVLGVLAVARQIADLSRTDTALVHEAIDVAGKACTRLGPEGLREAKVDRWVAELAGHARSIGVDPPCSRAEGPAASADRRGHRGGQ